MIVENIEFKLKDGRRALIRSPIDQDIPEVLEYLYISAGETDFLLRYPEECTKYTALPQHHLLGFETAQLEFHHLH